MSDLQLFHFINDFASRWGLLDWIARFLAGNLAYCIVAVMIAVWILKREHRRMLTVAFVSAAIARGIIVTLIRFFYHHPRPILVTDVHALAVNTEWSFPSGNASFFFALATGVYLYNRKWGMVLYFCALVIGLARIFVGVHWPSDILAGAVLGILVGVATYFVGRKIFNR